MSWLVRARPSLILAAALQLLASAGNAQAPCAEPRRLLASSAWEDFSATVEAYYLAPAGLSPVDLSPAQWAKLLGHALGRQRRYAAADESRQGRLECLRKAAEAALTDSLALLSRLGGGPATAEAAELLTRICEDAQRGFYDEEVLILTGVSPDTLIPSVLETEVFLPDSAAPLPELPQALGEPPRHLESAGPCRFRLDPSLFTDAKSAWTWALIRQPWREGYYYDTWAIQPEWPSDHPKRLQNRLRADQEVIQTGSKEAILHRVRELQRTCR